MNGRALQVVGVGLLYGAAINLGDAVAQSIFAARAGAAQLAPMFLVKGIFDVIAAAAYLPLTRGRSPRAVLALALAIYAATMIGGRLALLGDGAAPAFALYLGHECAGTILTIHWGVWVLDLFDASQARRLFPVVFTALGVGKIAGGAALAHLAGPLGAANLLWVAAAVAAVGAAAGGAVRTPHARHDEDDPDAEVRKAAPVARVVASWRRSWSSPLVRAIAASTAVMVFLRYGLKLASLDAVETHFAADADRIARFVGTYSAWANAAAIAIGLLVLPRLLERLGVGVVNAGYAVATAGAYAFLAAWPSLAAAVTARFVDLELKDAVKTPLSALFYGAEPPDRRAEARAFIFGAVIPAATIVTAVAFRAATRHIGVEAIVGAGLVLAAAFVAASLWQNRVWRRRLRELLDWKLARHPVAAAPAAPPEVAAAGEVACRAFRALCSPEPRLRAVGAEVLKETLPRRLAREVVAAAGGPSVERRASRSETDSSGVGARSDRSG